MSIVTDALRDAKRSIVERSQPMPIQEQKLQQPKIGLAHLMQMAQTNQAQEDAMKRAEDAKAMQMMQLEALERNRQQEQANKDRAYALDLQKYMLDKDLKVEKKYEDQIEKTNKIRENVFKTTKLNEDLENLKATAKNLSIVGSWFPGNASKEYNNAVGLVTDQLLKMKDLPKQKEAVQMMKEVASKGMTQSIDSYLNGIERLQRDLVYDQQAEYKRRLDKNYKLIDYSDWEWAKVNNQNVDTNEITLPSNKIEQPIDNNKAGVSENMFIDMVKGGANAFTDSITGLHNLLPWTDKIDNPMRMQTSGNNPIAETIGEVSSDVASGLLPVGALTKMSKAYKALGPVMKAITGGAAYGAIKEGANKSSDMMDILQNAGVDAGLGGGMTAALSKLKSKIVPKIKDKVRANKIKEIFGDIDYGTLSNSKAMQKAYEYFTRGGWGSSKYNDKVANIAKDFTGNAKKILKGDIDGTVDIDQRIGNKLKSDFKAKRESLTPQYNALLGKEAASSKEIFTKPVLDAITKRGFDKEAHNARTGHNLLSELKNDKRAALKRGDNADARYLDKIIKDATTSLEGYLGPEKASKYKSLNNQYKELVAPYKTDKAIYDLVRNASSIDKINIASKLLGKKQYKEYDQLIKILSPEERGHLLLKNIDNDLTPNKIIKSFENNKQFVAKYLTERQKALLDKAKTVDDILNIYNNINVTTKTGEKLFDLATKSGGVIGGVAASAISHDPILITGSTFGPPTAMWLLRRIIEKPATLEKLSRVDTSYIKHINTIKENTK